MPEERFPQIIDASMRADFKACPYQFYIKHVLQKIPAYDGTHLVAGGAFARGLEVTRRTFYSGGKSAEEALFEGQKAALVEYGDFEPSDERKSLERVLLGLEGYFEHFGLAEDHLKPKMTSKGPAVEFKFAVPIDLVHPETGEDLLYAGRYDMWAESSRGGQWIVDDKTSSRGGASWADNWRLRGQLIGYKWAHLEHGWKCDGVVVRGAIFLKERTYFLESLNMIPDHLVKSWYEQLFRDVRAMIRCYEEGVWDRDYSDACTSYGGCPFTDVCLSADPTRHIQAMETNLWNPIL